MKNCNICRKKLPDGTCMRGPDAIICLGNYFEPIPALTDHRGVEVSCGNCVDFDSLTCYDCDDLSLFRSSKDD